MNTPVVLEGRQFLSSVTEVHSLRVAQGAYLRKWNISTVLCSVVVLHTITGLGSVNCAYLMTPSQTRTHLDSHSPHTFTHILTYTEAYTCTCVVSCTCCVSPLVVSNSLGPHGLARLLCPLDFLKQEYWSGLPFPFPGDLPDPGIEPASPLLVGGFFTTEPPRKL